METNSLLFRQFEFSRNVAKLIQFINKSGYECSLKECLRPTEMEKIYREKGQSWLLNPNSDKHLNSLAIDICIFNGPVWIQDMATIKPIGNFWESLKLGNKWGGNWSVVDCLHFQCF